MTTPALVPTIAFTSLTSDLRGATSFKVGSNDPQALITNVDIYAKLGNAVAVKIATSTGTDLPKVTIPFDTKKLKNGSYKFYAIVTIQGQQFTSALLAGNVMNVEVRVR